MKEKSRRNSVILFILLIIVILFSAIFILNNYRQIGGLEKELSEAKAKLDAIVEENNEISELMEPENEDKLKEEEARKHGYGYPDESRYQNITPGNEGN